MNLFARSFVKKGWGLEWHSVNQLDGEDRHLIWKSTQPVIFSTRREAREFRQAEYGYIRTRADLRAEPHGWRFPQVMRVELELRKAR